MADRSICAVHACVGVSMARLLLSFAAANGVPCRLLPAGHVGGAPYEGLYGAWAAAVSRWGGRDASGTRGTTCCALR
jgi:hypothetical protein